MIDFLIHGLTCAFWCFFWHRLSHASRPKARPQAPVYTPPSASQHEHATARMFRGGGMSL